MVPSAAAAQVTDKLSIPTISVGAGPHCDGQLLVWTDWAGLTTGRIPKFVKQYARHRQHVASTPRRPSARTSTPASTPSIEHEYSE